MTAFTLTPELAFGMFGMVVTAPIVYETLRTIERVQAADLPVTGVVPPAADLVLGAGFLIGAAGLTLDELGVAPSFYPGLIGPAITLIALFRFLRAAGGGIPTRQEPS